MKTLTVFTPTFNRAHLLPRLYESLCCQTSDNFCWLIIDDGSTDGTADLIRKWKEENKLEIEYRYKQNGGMHTGHNFAYSTVQTELNVCIDSDDRMPPDAVAKILSCWHSVEDKSAVAGIIGLDADSTGKVIGTSIPGQLTRGSLTDLYQKYGVLGDKKLVLRTDIVRKFPPYPEYVNEKLVPLGILYLMIGKKYNFVYQNEIYCIVEYQPGGSSDSILRQYKQSPRGFAYARKVQIRHSIGAASVLKNYAHLVSSAFFAGDPKLAFTNVNPFMTLLVLPFGVMLHLYIRYKIRS